MITSTWQGCYDSGLKGLITSGAKETRNNQPALLDMPDPVLDSFSHPAKMAHNLARRIFEHGAAMGYWRPGDTILDPFGGIGTVGLVGAYLDYQVVLIELESHFYEMAQANFEKNRRKLQALGRPLPLVIQGDSRYLSEVAGAWQGVITSPPYADSINSEKHGIDWTKCKPDYAGRVMSEARIASHDRNHSERRYGSGEAQLGAMKEADYWQAVAQVYSELHKVLPTGAVAAIVVKDYIKNKRRVPLCDKTADLLESLGFAVIERTRALLVRERTATLLNGDEHVSKVERKSFFRRLHESKGGERIDWEEVIWAQVKP